MRYVSDNAAMLSTIVMTGGTSGFGRRAVELLLDDPRQRIILIARRSPQATSLASKFGPERLALVYADLADLEAVDQAATTALDLATGDGIDALALNAGVQSILGDRESFNGLELCFAVNHLAHFHLVERLKKALKPDGRIIVTTSEVHDPAAFCMVGITRARWEDPLAAADPRRSQGHLTTLVDRGEARYCASKLLNLLHVRHLAETIPGIAVIGFNPSVVPGTEIARDRNVLQLLGWKYLMPLLAPIVPGLRTMDRSAGDLAWLLTAAPPLTLSGHYVNGRQVEPGSNDSRDPAKIKRMVEVSHDLIRVHLAHLLDDAPAKSKSDGNSTSTAA